MKIGDIIVAVVGYGACAVLTAWLAYLTALWVWAGRPPTSDFREFVIAALVIIAVLAALTSCVSGI